MCVEHLDLKFILALDKKGRRKLIPSGSNTAPYTAQIKDDRTVTLTNEDGDRFDMEVAKLTLGDTLHVHCTRIYTNIVEDE